MGRYLIAKSNVDWEFVHEIENIDDFHYWFTFYGKHRTHIGKAARGKFGRDFRRYYFGDSDSEIDSEDADQDWGYISRISPPYLSFQHHEPGYDTP